VQHAGVAACLLVFQRGLQHFGDLDRAGPFRRGVGLQIPQLPGGAVQQGLGKQGHHVEVVAMLAVHRAHRIGVVVVPACQFLRRDRLAGLAARPQGFDQCLFHRTGGGGGRARTLERHRAA